jgi:hypothetical protein
MYARLILLLVCLLLTACPDKNRAAPVTPTPNPNPNQNPTSTTGLGNAAQEAAYYASQGNGLVQVVYDPTINDVGYAQRHPLTGQPIVLLNPNALASLHPTVAAFFTIHEFGHHYLNCLDGPPSKRNESLADAYATRVLLYNGADSSIVRSWFQSTGSPGDATHPSHAERAAYIQQVTAAYQANPAVVPEPPVSGQAAPGVLTITNPLSEPCIVNINGQYAGGLYAFQTASLQLPAGGYVLVIVGYYSASVYGPYSLTVFAGQTTFFP